ncbi:hypothetical protein EVAR_13642_1 [Eumeta japonica]|uniref:Mariner Mos1 transposase n=1 Tax=Eumeta variegata TaxID=151549 RepID=A0A4C1UTU8_EUMVA|nr:hypothetical protein EVAR_13642_1 [Eumeta japonica]
MLHKFIDEKKECRVDRWRFTIEKSNRSEKKTYALYLTGDETWLYDLGPGIKRHSTVWCFEFETTPTKSCPARSTQIQMVATFFCWTGHIATLVLEDQKLVMFRGMCQFVPQQCYQLSVRNERSHESGTFFDIAATSLRIHLLEHLIFST